MTKDMRYYIDIQQAALRMAQEHASQTVAPFVRLWQDSMPDRLYLVGSGTSGNACRAAAGMMEQVLGVETTAVSPTSLPALVHGKPLFVFVSQGGQSTNTVRAIEQLCAWPGIALTGEQNCRINEVCPAHIVLTCEHEEAGPKTMGYTCTILTLYHMALEAALAIGALTQDAYQTYQEKLSRMIDHMGENVALTWRWLTAERAARLLEMHDWAVVGAGTSRFVAGEAALKLQETILRPAAGFEFEEFLHGPTMMYNASMGGMYLLPTGSDRDRMLALSSIHAGFGSQVINVTCGEKAELCGDTLVYAADVDEFLAPFWQILPGQVMGALLPTLAGCAGKGSEIFQMIDRAVGVKCRK